MKKRKLDNKKIGLDCEKIETGLSKTKTGLFKLKLECETLGLDGENLDWTVSLLGHLKIELIENKTNYDLLVLRVPYEYKRHLLSP